MAIEIDDSDMDTSAVASGGKRPGRLRRLWARATHRLYARLIPVAYRAASIRVADLEGKLADAVARHEAEARVLKTEVSCLRREVEAFGKLYASVTAGAEAVTSMYDSIIRRNNGD